MSGQIELKFFDTIVWIDPNKAIRTEATHLIWMYGPRVEVFQKAADAVEFIQQNMKSNILVLCASREVESCFKAFNKLPNVYPKYIVFCGSRNRATEVKTFSLAKDAIEDAFWEIGDLVNGISQLEDQLLEQPELMKLKVTIVQHKLAPVISQSQAPMFLQNLKKKNEQSELQKAKQEQKIHQILSSASSKSESITKTEAQAKKEGEEQSQQCKIKQNARIIWAYDVDDDQQKKEIQRLQKKGYPVHTYQKPNELKYLVNDDPEFQYYLIAKASAHIEDLKTNINNNPMTIRIGREGEGQQIAEDEVFATGVNEIIKHLETSIKKS